MIDLLILVVFGATANAGWIELFDFCLQPGNIFQRYGKWLDDKHAEYSLKYNLTGEYPEKLFWLKAAGHCKYCLQVWVCLVTYPVIVYLTDVNWYIYLIFLPAYMGISHLILYRYGS